MAAETSFPQAEEPWNIGPWRVAHADDTGVVGSTNGTERSLYVNSTGMYVFRRAGDRWTQGIYGTHDEEKQITVPDNATGSVRYDRVVDRLLANGSITTEIKTGTSSGPPALTQVVGGTWEESLGSFPVASGATTLTPLGSPVTDERRFMPRRVTPVSSEALRPSAPAVGDEVDFPDGTRQRWNGSAWKTTSATALSDWTMAVTSGVYGWPPTAQYGSWRRDGDTVEALASTSLNVNPPGSSVGQLTFALPPGVIVPNGVFLGFAELGPAGGGVTNRGSAFSDGNVGRLYSFGSPINVAPGNGYTLTVNLRFTAA